MRRKDKLVSEQAELHQIIQAAPYMVVGFQTGAEPYLVPLDFGFDGEYIYFHCAREGRKLDLLRENPNISLLFIDYGGVFSSGKDDTACSYSTRFGSVMASGKALILENTEDKKKAFHTLMRKIGKEDLPLREGMLDITCVVRVELSGMVGKRSPAAPKK